MAPCGGVGCRWDPGSGLAAKGAWISRCACAGGRSASHERWKRGAQGKGRGWRRAPRVHGRQTCGRSSHQPWSGAVCSSRVSKTRRWSSRKIPVDSRRCRDEWPKSESGYTRAKAAISEPGVRMLTRDHEGRDQQRVHERPPWFEVGQGTCRSAHGCRAVLHERCHTPEIALRRSMATRSTHRVP